LIEAHENPLDPHQQLLLRSFLEPRHGFQKLLIVHLVATLEEFQADIAIGFHTVFHGGRMGHG
jgi:hypothetical protein